MKKSNKNKDNLILLIKLFLISFFPIFLIWMPFFLPLDNFLFLKIKDGGMENILKNWDGPNYVLLAKSFYNPHLIDQLRFVSTLPTSYFFAHFPLYPLLIKIFGFLTINLFYSGLLVNLIFGFFLNLVFYYFIKEKTKHPLFLTFVFTIFPPRFWVIRSIIAPETLMSFLILLSLIFFERKKYFFSSIFGGLAILTKIQSFFIFPAYMLAMVEKIFKKKEKINLSFFLLALIPLSLIFLFSFYYFKTGDFFIFLKAQKENNLYFYFPFSQFNYQGAWVGTGWLEDVVFYFLGLAILTIGLSKVRQRSFFYFSLIYSLFLIFIPHRDIGRYTYSLAPLFYWQFANFFESKLFRLAFLFVLPAFYFYALNFLLVNQAPLADWGRLIK